MIKSSYSSRI